MSIQHSAFVWENSEHSGNKLLLLLAIADHANQDGLCWPSIPTLAKKIRLSERQTMRLIKQLCDSGELALIQRGDGRGKANVYQIKGDIAASGFSDMTLNGKGDILDTKGDIAMSGFGGAAINGKGDILDKRVTFENKKGDIAVSHQPSIEPSIESEEGEEEGSLPRADAPPENPSSDESHDESTIPANESLPQDEPPMPSNGTYNGIANDLRPAWSAARKKTYVRNYDGIDAKLHTELTNELKRICGMGVLIESPGTDKQENDYRDAAYNCYKKGIADIDAMKDVADKWFVEARRKKFTTLEPYPNQFYEFTCKIASTQLQSPSSKSASTGIAYVPNVQLEQQKLLESLKSC